jgi:type VI secretion system secreted protein VgrG
MATGLPCPGGNVLTGMNLGGLTLAPGVYCFSSSAFLTGTLVLNGGGNPNAQFIFQIGTTITTASGSVVSLINSAQPANVFWALGTSATIGTATSFAGNILALASITFNTAATLAGRALAGAAVTLDSNAIGIPGLPGAPPVGVPITVPTTPAPTPVPSSLILVGIGLACAGMYQARERLLGLLRGN